MYYFCGVIINEPLNKAIMKSNNITPEMIAAQAMMLLENDKAFAAEMQARNEQDERKAQEFLAVAAIYALWKANK